MRAKDALTDAMAAVSAAVRRHVTELAITFVALGIGLAVWLGASTEWGVVVTAAAAMGSALSIAYTEGAFREQRRQERKLEHEREVAEIHEMRTIAELARGLLLDATVWQDIEDWKGRWQAELGNPRRRPLRSLEWSIAAIVARGREALRPAEVHGWSQIAQLIRDHAQYLTSRIDQEFPGPPAERRSELSVLFRAAEKAAEGADGLAGATRRSFELFYSGGPDDKERAEQAVQEYASFFFGACEWVQGCVERLDDREEFARSIAETAERHRAAAADLLRAARDVHAAAAAAAETLLAAAAPEPDDLERSTIGRRDASLRDIARADSFALAAEDDEDAVYRWLRRVPPAQRAFHEAVMDRGAEMNEATHTLWTQIHNDGVLELENALRGLQGDLHAQGGTPPPPANFADAIATNIAEGRAELAAAIQRLVDRIDRFQKLVIN